MAVFGSSWKIRWDIKLIDMIIIFDGVCNFCNFWVDFLMKRDRKEVFRFTANQHQAGKQILQQYGETTSEVGTVYVLENEVLYKESNAVLRIVRKLPGLWPLLYVFVLIPRVLRDPVYKWVANNRYRWFGKKETCRIPTPEERERFLL